MPGLEARGKGMWVGADDLPIPTLPPGQIVLDSWQKRPYPLIPGQVTSQEFIWVFGKLLCLEEARRVIKSWQDVPSAKRVHMPALGKMRGCLRLPPHPLLLWPLLFSRCLCPFKFDLQVFLNIIIIIQLPEAVL